VWMLLAASRSCKSWGLLDALDAMEGVDVVTSVVTQPADAADASGQNARSAASEPLAAEGVGTNVGSGCRVGHCADP
jgi:hypothetical protein